MARVSVKKLLYGGAAVCFFIISLAYSSQGREVIVMVAKNCFVTVIPAVFPCAVMGALVGTGVAEFPNFLKRVISFVFGISVGASGALLAGLFTGFPVGASGACGLYLRNRISSDDLCRTVAFSATPGCAFVIMGVGVGMFESTEAGILIYLCTVFSVFLVGFLTKNRKKQEKKRDFQIPFYETPTPSLFEAITESVAKSGAAMVNLTAFVVFFSLVSFFLTEMLSSTFLPHWVSVALSGFLEVTVGCQMASTLNGSAGILFALAFCSFGGLSVQMQSGAVCTQCKVSGLYKRVFWLRILVLLCAIATLSLVRAAGLY